MSITIALAGNPNSGKTTLFNALTGASQYVGNWPGVTVEKKEGKLKGHKDVTITDLPGVYSLSPYTLEEVVSRNYLLNDRPDVIINIIDATNIERNLYLTTQLTEIGIPVIVALNMIDAVRKNGDKINAAKLSKELGCVVMETSALKGIGTKEVADQAVKMASGGAKTTPMHKFSDTVESSLFEIAQIIDAKVSDKDHLRFYSVKLFGRDEKAQEKLSLDVPTKEKIEAITAICESKLDDDSESIITAERYEYIEKVIENTVVKKGKGKTTRSDKIDKIVTNRWLALPIFALIMWLVYFISVTTVGTIATDWANDGVFGDGWHLLGIGDAQYQEVLGEYESQQVVVEEFLAAAEEDGIDTADLIAAMEAEGEKEEADNVDTETADAEETDGEVAVDFDAALDDFKSQATNVVADIEDEESGETTTATLADFESAMEAGEPDPAEYGIWVPGVPVLVEGWLESAEAPEWLSGLILDGIVGGVGAVLGFVPQLLILFLLLAFLEDCGYMARVAFIMDRVLRKFGLSGKSFIPFLISSGCGVPGIMASRTIENEKDRRMTIILTTFIPCGAKLPIIALIAGAMFPGETWVGPFSYFLGIAIIILSGIILKKTKLFASEPAPFVMELPQYHMPAIKGLFTHMWERGKSFIVKAGTIIFLACGLVWFLSSFGFGPEGFGMVAEDESMLATIGNAIAWIFVPLGFGDWRSAVATLSGFVAKENVVGTFGVLFGLAEAAEDDPTLLASLATHYTALSAMSFMIFNLLCAPCFAAIGAAKRELGGWKWTLIAIGYQTLLAYVVSFIVYQLGMIFVTGGITPGAIISGAAILAVIWLLVRKGQPSAPSISKGISA